MTLAPSVTLHQCMACSRSIKDAGLERSFTGCFNRTIDEC